MNIILIGMPGCGKSVFGRRLASKLGRSFYDADAELEKIYGETISEIFEKYGEDEFRRRETETMRTLCEKDGVVISTGGGVVKNQKNIEIAKKSGAVVFLNRPLEHIMRDVDTSKRPLLKDGKARLRKLYDERIGLYKKYADLEVRNDKNFNITLSRLIREVEKYENRGN